MTKIEKVSGRIRALQLVVACERAGIAPVLAQDLHIIAYLGEALAPVWGADSQTASFQKTGLTPFFRALQETLDDLTISGLLTVSDFGYEEQAAGWRLVAKYSTSVERTGRILAAAHHFAEEELFFNLYLEICLAVAESGSASAIISRDFLLSDPRVSDGRMITFRPPTGQNISANVADLFDQAMPDGRLATPGEKVHLYIELLRRRASAVA